MDFKSMSFGKLMGIFGGAFFLILIIAVVIVKASASPKPPVTPVKKLQTRLEAPPPDLLAEQLRLAEESNAKGREALQRAAMQLQAQNQALGQKIDGLTGNIHTLEQRLVLLESKRPARHVEIIKPDREPRQEVKKLTEKEANLSTLSGYSVRASVGSRVWLVAGDKEDSVRIGEQLPPIVAVASKPLIVHAVEPETGTVITSTAP